jgi:hypothetical protein
MQPLINEQRGKQNKNIRKQNCATFRVINRQLRISGPMVVVDLHKLEFEEQIGKYHA